MKEEVGRLIVLRAQELREGRGGRTGLPGVPNMVLMVSVDVKRHLKKKTVPSVVVSTAEKTFRLCRFIRL